MHALSTYTESETCKMLIWDIMNGCYFHCIVAKFSQPLSWQVEMLLIGLVLVSDWRSAGLGLATYHLTDDGTGRMVDGR